MNLDPARQLRDPAVSVIVPVYNAAMSVDGCLAALDGQTLAPEDYEVVVVDDDSTDGTPARVRAFAEGARARVALVAQPSNRGPAAARNAGLGAARGSIVAFTDADCEAAPDWLERGLERLRAEPVTAGVEGRTDPKGEPGTLTHQMSNQSGGLFMTCNMLYRRAALDAAGGFDERFRAPFLEDSDVAFSVMEAGGVIAFAPEVIVNHLVLPEGRRKFWRDARKRYWNALLYRKHAELYRRHIAPVVPGIPGLYGRFLLLLVLFVAGLALMSLAPLWSVLAGGASPFLALSLRRIAHAHRARDPLSIIQVAILPFVQLVWVVAGAIRFRANPFRL